MKKTFQLAKEIREKAGKNDKTCQKPALGWRDALKQSGAEYRAGLLPIRIRKKIGTDAPIGPGEYVPKPTAPKQTKPMAQNRTATATQRSQRSAKKKELTKALLIKDFEKDIPADTAARAYYNTSFSPEVRAKNFIKEYGEDLWAAYKQAGDTVSFDKFRAGLKSRALDWLSAKSKTFSVMITGGGNFNTTRHRKSGDAEQRKGEEYYRYINSFMSRKKRAEQREEINQQKTGSITKTG